MDEKYFAGLPAADLAPELIYRVDQYFQWLLTSGRLARWRAANDTYYGSRGSHSSHYVAAAGEQGELSFLMSNEYRNLVQHVVTMATKSKPALETVAVNQDSKSKAQAYVAKGIIEYYRRDGKIDSNLKHALEISMIMDVGWVFNEWDVNLGEEVAVDPETNQSISQGDIYSRCRTPLEVVVDHTRPGGMDHDWIIVKDPVNKYDLAAQYPKQADDLVGLERDASKDPIFQFGDQQDWEGSKSTLLDRWTFYHRKTKALPMGRMFQFVTAKDWLFDGPIPYRKLPGNRICPNEQIMSGMGYSNANDLLALQDVLDALISSGVTNMTTLGVNNVWIPDPANLQFKQLAEGMNVFGGDQEPKVIQMNKLSPEWFNLANFILQRMQSQLGVSAAARGDLQGKDLSGAALALLQSMSIEFNSGVTAAFTKGVEDCGNDVVMLTQDFAKEKRVGMIIGQANKYMQKEYSAKDVSEIQRVYVRSSNPMKDTTAGRLTIAQDMIKMGAVKTPQQYGEILDTGSLDSLMEVDRNDRLTIDMENDAIIRGEPVIAVFSDFHPDHLVGHRKPLSNPEDRTDPGLIQRLQEHIQEHLRVWETTDPNILAAYGIPPMIPPPMPLGPDGQPMPPPGPGGPPGSPPTVPGGPKKEGSGGPPGPGGMEKPPADGPGMPTNPLTGQKWNPDTGGL